MVTSKIETNGLTADERADARVRSMMAGYLGKDIMAAFDDDDITEIYYNPHEQCVRYDTHSRGKYLSDHPISSGKVLQFLNAAATLLGEEFSRNKPEIEGELPLQMFGGARLEGVCPQRSIGPAMVIAKLPTKIYPLSSYVTDGIMTKAQLEAVHEAVARKDNIVVSGTMKSGKSTLTNAIIQEITEKHPRDRIAILEDTRELICTAPDHIALRVSRGGDLARLVYTTYRFDVARVIVGECRGPEIPAMLDVWTTGHPGVCTVHASDAAATLHRLRRWAGRESRGSVEAMGEFVAEAIDTVVVIHGSNEGRRVHEIVRVEGFERREFRFSHLAA